MGDAFVVRGVDGPPGAGAYDGNGADEPRQVLRQDDRRGLQFPEADLDDIAEQMGASPAETLARFAAEIDSSGHPPGPNDSWLGEALVHAEDIRHPLKIQRAYPTECAVQVADFYKGSNLLIGAKKRIDGLTLVATDTDWRHGAGPEVSGPIMSLVLAMTGRKAAMGDLSGPGVQTLEARSH
jgi:uncharacterized protein (TIGR03083 family)